MNKASIMNLFFFKQTEGANLQALANSILLLGSFQWELSLDFFFYQLKTMGKASGISDLRDLTTFRKSYMQPDLNKDAIVEYQREAYRYIPNTVKAYYKEQVHRIPLKW